MQRPVRRPAMQATEWLVLALCAAAILVPVLTRQGSPGHGAFHAGTAPAVLIAMLTGVHMWARRSGRLSSTRYLAMFSLVLAVYMAMSGFILREEPAYTWTMLVIGSLVALANVAQAVLSRPSREGLRPLDPRTNV